MAELVARGSNPEDGWRRTLPPRPVTLGRAPGADVEWAVPWDRQISALHAIVDWNGKRLTVRRVPRGRNPLFFRGVPEDEFAVAIGESFAIGSTTFTVEDEAAPAAPRRDIDLSCTAEELRSMKFFDAEERIDVLAALPELIRLSLSEEELERQVLKVLLRGIPHADAAAVVRASPRPDGGEPEVEVRASEVRNGAPAQVRPSRRLVWEAVGPRGQGVLHRWDSKDGAFDLAPNDAFDWALCVPLAAGACPGWGLYVTGSLRDRPGRGNRLSQRPLLRGDLKFAQMAADIFAALRQVLELQAMQLSLHVAKQIQASFFPQAPHQPDGYEVAGVSRSADATGGDYFDVLPLPSGKLGLVVADVTGHGLGPSLLMASVRSLLRAGALREPAPEALIRDLNEAQYADLHPICKFVTLLYGTLCPTHHQFRFANAGHGPVAMHLQVGRDRCRLLTDDDGCGAALGLLREGYRACTPLDLEPGDLFVLGSDGLVETVRDGNRYGMERFTEFVFRHKDQPLSQIINAVIDDTTAFHERARPDDDLTLLMVRRK